MAEQLHQAEFKSSIVLLNSDRAQNFNLNNLVHRDEFEATLALIRRGLRQAIDFPDRDYIHDTITLLGSRGSGKTSFLLTIAKWIASQDDEIKNKELSGIQVLDIIDPTLIEEKAHVFLNVISLIQQLVDRKLQKDEVDFSKSRTHGSSRKEWRSVLNKLAAGLPSIDGVGGSSDDGWQDPEFVMDNGLKAVASSQALAKNFNELLRISLQILDKKAFLIIFDDIDVDTTKGWAVLETIRKYFTGARLITIISGDLELYTKVVRQKKWTNFGKELIRYEGELSDGKKGIEEFRRLTTRLADQYMLKIMQPQFRVHLNSLLHKKLSKGRLDIGVAYNDSDPFVQIEKVYAEVFRRYGIVNSLQTEVSNTFILGQPLRSQIQFLLVLMDKMEEDKQIDNNALADIFLSDLYEQGIDVSIGANTPKYLVIVILQLLLSKQKLEDSYQLQPTTTDEGFNAALFTLNMMLANTIKKSSKFLIFEYLLKVGYVRNLMTTLRYRVSPKDSNESFASIEGLCEQSGVLNDGILRDITGRMQAYLYGSFQTDQSSDITPYFIQIKSLKRLSRQAVDDRIDTVFSADGVNKATKMLGFIPCLSGTFSYKNESRVFYSFYMLLAAIGEIVKQYETLIADEEHERMRQTLMLRLLKELSQLRAYPVVSFTGRESEGVGRERQGTESPNVDDPEDNSDVSLSRSLLSWLEAGERFAVAGHLLGKISTRFFYAMSNIAEASSKDISLGELFHRQVVAFMNAVLIEDVREYQIQRLVRINLNNTNTDDAILINNLRNVTRFRKSALPDPRILSKWLLCCPLLLSYLKDDKDSQLRKSLGLYCADKFADLELYDFDIQRLLDQVSLRSKDETQASGQFPIVKGTRRLLRNTQSLADLLKQSNIPFEWFVDADRKEAGRRNDLIRKHIASVFGDDTGSSIRIRNFRNSLANLGIRW